MRFALPMTLTLGLDEIAELGEFLVEFTSTHGTGEEADADINF